MDTGLETEPGAVPVRFRPLFEARWSYEEFTRVMPFGASSEGQALAFSEPSRVEGEALTGSYALVQFPRWRADDLFVPDGHGMIRTDKGDRVMTRLGGYVVPDAPGEWRITHWMGFWTDARELMWLNTTVAFGVGSMVDDEARVRYFAPSPADGRGSATVTDAPRLRSLGTARWHYPGYEAVRPFGDSEGVGFATSVGDVHGGALEGRWRGWHYPSYLRDGLYQLDAHAEIRAPRGVILTRHGGLATRPAQPSDAVTYAVVQHATFVTEAPGLEGLNRTLGLGVGYVRAPDRVTVSYYGVSP